MKLKTFFSATLISTFLMSSVCQADAASGLPTGKRQHKPVSITKPVDKASPLLMKTAASSMQNAKDKNQNNHERTGYRLCPDGTMIHPGEKCPEKSSKR